MKEKLLDWVSPFKIGLLDRYSAGDYEIVEDFPLLPIVRGWDAPLPKRKGWNITYRGQLIGQTLTLRQAKAFADRHHRGASFDETGDRPDLSEEEVIDELKRLAREAMFLEMAEACLLAREDGQWSVTEWMRELMRMTGEDNPEERERQFEAALRTNDDAAD
jgi:hypothetical protein